MSAFRTSATLKRGAMSVCKASSDLSICRRGASISIPRPMPWASTANFLKAHGWVRGAGYQPGEPNFAAIQGWNAARVYEEAIATIGRQIDEH
jgi:hypothetical protein